MKKYLLITGITMASLLLSACWPWSSKTATTTNTVDKNSSELCGDNVCDAAEQADTNLCPADCGTITKTTTETESISFIPDEEIRMDNASNAGVKMHADGTISLLYEDRSSDPHVQRIATSEEGLTFNAGTQVTPEEAAQFRAITLPDGTCRAYGYNTTKGLSAGENGLTSMTAEDCINYTQDEGYRYTLHEDDNGTFGVYEFFADSKGGIVMLYLGDLFGLNNTRRAYSTDNGWTFTFDHGDVFGDSANGGGPNSYVDEKAIVLQDGTIRVVAMKQGKIYTFLSTDDGETFVFDGEILTPENFTTIGATSLHDPQIMMLADGRLRIYVTALLSDNENTPDDDSNSHQAIVSATTPGTR